MTVPTVVLMGLVLTRLKVASLATGGRLGVSLTLVRLTVIIAVSVKVPSLTVTVRGLFGLTSKSMSSGSATRICPLLLMVKAEIPSPSRLGFPAVIL